MSDDLRQANLSDLSVKQMTPAQRAELRRRFEAFVANFVKPAPGAEKETAPKVRKWVPGMKK
jgi:L-2-hydroxyglutarate oxidase LhgO